jgi:hypothetical protein
MSGGGVPVEKPGHPAPKPVPQPPVPPRPVRPAPGPADPFVRAANEDDDGYDPYSDRPARTEPLFERNPWA